MDILLCTYIEDLFLTLDILQDDDHPKMDRHPNLISKMHHISSIGEVLGDLGDEPKILERFSWKKGLPLSQQRNAE